MNKKILVVDDEIRMRKLVRDFLEKEKFTVIEAADGEEAIELYYQTPDIDLIILDVMMPKMNGYEVVEEIREQGNTVPILMLTAKSEEKDELKGFRMGVDEFVTKPFSPRVLVARVNAIIRRVCGDETNQLITAGGIEINTAAHSVKSDGKEIELSIKEYELLMFFMNNQGIALSRDRILSQVWDYDYFGDARTIDTHVKKLRNKLGTKGDFIKTVWGMGYKFEAAE